MKIFIGILVLVVAFITFAILKERRTIIQYVESPNGNKYKISYSINVERYKWWFDKYPKVSYSLTLNDTRWDIPFYDNQINTFKSLVPIKNMSLKWRLI